MTFDEWAELLDLRASTFAEFPPTTEDKKAWRCAGPCGQLMYGIWRYKGKNYPSSNIPAGSFISAELPRVCEVCWALNNTLADRNYWVQLRATDKKKYNQLKREGDFLA